MIFSNAIKTASVLIGIQVLAGVSVIPVAGAAEPCGLCDRKIVTNSVLASCFIAEFEKLTTKKSAAVVVDLSDCEQDRGVVDALRMPGAGIDEPDVRFILSPEQMSCLKSRLEQPGLVLDPTAIINLDDCE